MTTFEIGLVLPCYNYESGLPGSLQRVKEWRQRCGLRIALCIVDDGSSDKSVLVAQEFQAKNPDWCQVVAVGSNRGKGHAIRQGVRALDESIPFIFFTDGDLHYGLNVISDRMLPMLKAGADLVVLDRSWNRQFHAGSSLRKMLSHLFMHLKTVLTGVTLDDSQAGMKGFRGDFIRGAQGLTRIDGFAFDVELLSIAIRHRFRIEQVPILITGASVQEGSSMTPRKALRMLWDLLRIAAGRFSGHYTSDYFHRRISGQVYEIDKRSF
jgi:dolichyl-phosphate beta-glucosyltransferase